MGNGPKRRRKTHKNIKFLRKSVKTANRAKDLDQIQKELSDENKGIAKPKEIDPDLPGLGQFYCLTCAKYFVNSDALKEHSKGKVHRRKVKLANEKPYSQEEADAAAGMGRPDKGKPSSKMIDH